LHNLWLSLMQQLASHGQKSLLGLEEAANHRSALPQRLVKGTT
jgi:hypothetical protein